MSAPDYRTGAGLNLTPRYAPARVIVAGILAGVSAYRAYPPGAHPPGCPLIAACTAVELVTPAGSRWYACLRAYINARLRFVVVGTDPRDEVRMAWARVPMRDRDVPTAQGCQVCRAVQDCREDCPAWGIRMGEGASR